MMLQGIDLPSVTTVLGTDQKSTILKRLDRPKLEKQKQSESRIYLVSEGLAMHKYP